MALLLITHDLGIVRKMAARVSVMTEGLIVEAWPDRASLRQPAARIHAPPAGGRAQGPPREGGAGRAGGDERRRHQGVVPDQGRRAAPRGRSREGGRRHLLRDPRGSYGRHRRRERIRQDHARPGAAAAHPERGRHPIRRHAHRRPRAAARCARCAGRCRSCSRIPMARCRRGFRSARSSPRASRCTNSASPRRSARR